MVAEKLRLKQQTERSTRGNGKPPVRSRFQQNQFPAFGVLGRDSLDPFGGEPERPRLDERAGANLAKAV